MSPYDTLGPMKKAGLASTIFPLVFLLFVVDLVSQPQSTSFLWRYSTGGKIRGRPAVTEDGAVYIVSEDRHLYAFEERTGRPIWRSYLKGRVWGGLSIGPDGTVYTVLKSGTLLAINPSGGIAWEYEAEGIPIGDPAVSSDGTVFFALDTGELHAIAHNGKIRWSVELKAAPSTSPVIGVEGDIYIGCVNRQIYAYRPWGEERWNAVLAGVPTEPAISEGNVLAYGTDYGSLVVISAEGEILWDHVFDVPVLAPIISGNRIFAATENGEILSTDLWGEVRWNIDLPKKIQGPIVLTAADELLIVSSDNSLLRVRDDGLLLEQTDLAFASNRFVLSPRGVLIFGRDDWLVYAYPASRPHPLGWAQIRRNPQHTGAISAMNFESLLLAEFREEAEYSLLHGLLQSDYSASKELALSILKDQVLGRENLSPYADLFLYELAAEGTLKVSLQNGQIINDFPLIRREAALLLSLVGDLHAVDLLAGLLSSEYDRAVQLTIVRALGSLVSDRNGKATSAIADKVLGDLLARDRPDPRLATEALQALQAIYTYHGTMPDRSGYDAVLAIYRGAYPMIVREKALEVLRSYRE